MVADSPMDTALTEITVQTANRDFRTSQLSPMSPPDSEPDVATVVDKAEDDFDTTSLASRHSLVVPETPGFSLTSKSSSRSESLNDAVPVIGTPLAIGALKLRKHPAVSYLANTPFRNQNASNVNFPRSLNRSDTVLVVSGIKYMHLQIDAYAGIRGG